MKDKTKSTSITQAEAEAMMNTIYTPEKKTIFTKEMDSVGEKFINGEMSFDEYMDFRRDLRKRLGFPE
jgi:hypothetical protein